MDNGNIGYINIAGLQAYKRILTFLKSSNFWDFYGLFDLWIFLINNMVV